jgi:outer membrane protein TolC
MRRLRSESLILILGVLFAAISAWGQTAPASASSAGGGGNAQSGSGSGNASGAPSVTAFLPAAQGGDFSGSVPTQPIAGVLPVSLQDAIDRGLKQNLGVLISNTDIGTARGQRWQELAALLPHVNVTPYADVSEVNLAEFGFTFHFPGVNIPTIVGPFSYLDMRANFSQSIFNLNAITNTRAAQQKVKSAEYTYKDARDVVVLSVGNSYLQAIADESLIDSVDAQVKTAQALFDQASDQVNAGTSPAIDALRAKVELQTRQQQLIQAKNNFAIQKLSLARIIGLAPGQQFELTDKALYQPFEGLTVDDALKRAYASRSDYQAAAATVRAAEYSRKAATEEHYPSLSFTGDYGGAGQHFSTLQGVFDVRGTLTIPIFAGGAIRGDVQQAEAQLQESRDRLENVRAQIDADVRVALLNLDSASQQVAVAQSNIDLAGQSLTQSRDRFAAGVTDTVEVVQAEEAVATAQQNYISSLYSFNYAKISLARAMGTAEASVKEYFKGK